MFTLKSNRRPVVYSQEHERSLEPYRIRLVNANWVAENEVLHIHLPPTQHSSRRAHSVD